MISFIVSVYDRVDPLNACLASLRAQTKDRDAQIIVCDNWIEENNVRMQHEMSCRFFGAKIIRTGEAGAQGPYDSANMVIRGDCNEWLCFPSDDSLYVAGFSEIMLHEAERNKTAGVIHCDMNYRQHPSAGLWHPYTILESEPRMGRIDKTNFIIRRELFKGFPPHPKDWRDGALIEQLIAQGVKMFKAPGCLVLHQ